MNLLLLEQDELSPKGLAHLRGRRALHAASVLGAKVGSALRVGVVGGRTGTGTVLALGPDTAGESTLSLAVTLTADPPPRSPVTLLLALPRPKVLRRVLQAVASMGLAKLVLLGSFRVERSYFGSPFLRPEAVRRELCLGLEQGRDTIPPEVIVRRLFKPFVEDELDAWAGAAERLLADPAGATALDELAPRSGEAALAVGPEGGFTPYEAALLARHGFTALSLGPRPLRVETAVPFAIGQVEPWLRRAHRG